MGERRIVGQPGPGEAGSRHGRLRNVSPEFDDVAAVAAATGIPAKDVLARATAAAYRQLDAGA